MHEGWDMHLLALELENFKSFKGEVTIPLEEGFTAVTGPNGSGKSNIGDAIQFVLGPKSSKSLRAQNLKQLIYNGGEKGRAARKIVRLLYTYFDSHRSEIPPEFRARSKSEDNVVADFISGMTDKYALRAAERIEPRISAPFNVAV